MSFNSFGQWQKQTNVINNGLITKSTQCIALSSATVCYVRLCEIVLNIIIL